MGFRNSGRLALTGACAWLALSCGLARAEFCEEKNLEKPGGCMAGVAPLNQGTEGMCWAHAYANLVDSYRFCSLGQTDHSFRTSPETIKHAADSHKLNQYYAVTEMRRCKPDTPITEASLPAPTEGGYPMAADRAFRDVLGGRVCNAQSTSTFASAKNRGSENAAFQNTLDSLYQSVSSLTTDRFKATRKLSPPTAFSLSYEDAYQQCNQATAAYNSTAPTRVLGQTIDLRSLPENSTACQDERNYIAGFRTLLAAKRSQVCALAGNDVPGSVLNAVLDSFQVATVWARSSEEQVENQILNTACARGRSETIHLPTLQRVENTKDAIVGAIDHSLEANKASLISFCAGGLFKSPEASGISHMVGETTSCHEFNVPCGHAAVVVGRKKIGGACYYGIKNSWGADCSGYDATRTAHCDEHTGTIWVTLDELRNNTKEAFHF